MTAGNWRDQFNDFARTLAGQNVYVTIDLDCLRAEDAITNWENGLFTPHDLGWALGQLQQSATIVAGDLCGAYSEPKYATRFQRLAGWWDHPRVKLISLTEAQRVNLKSLEVIWPALVSP
jgi:hypothetical protein